MIKVCDKQELIKIINENNKKIEAFIKKVQNTDKNEFMVYYDKRPKVGDYYKSYSKEEFIERLSSFIFDEEDIKDEIEFLKEEGYTIIPKVNIEDNNYLKIEYKDEKIYDLVEFEA